MPVSLAMRRVDDQRAFLLYDGELVRESGTGIAKQEGVNLIDTADTPAWRHPEARAAGRAMDDQLSALRRRRQMAWLKRDSPERHAYKIRCDNRNFSRSLTGLDDETVEPARHHFWNTMQLI